MLRQYVDHYHRRWPHLALGLQPPVPEPTPTRGTGAVVRRQRLYGLINEYSRAA